MSSSSYTDLIKSGVDEYERSTSAGRGSRRNMSLCLSDRIADAGGSGGIPKFKTLPPPSLPLSSPASSSSYFAIPPGLSPADLLDSPVLLSSSSVLPSPTTGAIAAQSLKWKANTSANTVDHNNSNEQDGIKYSDFTFHTQPPPSHVPSSIFHSSSIPSFPSLSVCLMSSNQKQQPECWWNSREHSNQNEASSSIKVKAMVKTEFPTSYSQAAGLNDIDNHTSNQIQNPNPIHHQSLSQQYGSGSGSGNKRTSEDDGFNWRKYGQKQVKGSENPRSYYKCTYPNCPMKKKTERSLDGHITEIVYKGSHNHPKPVHPRRSASASFQAAASLPFQDPDPCLLPFPQGPGSSSSAQTDSVATPDNSSVSVVDDDGLDMASQRSRSAVDDFDDHDDAPEPDAKRWKADQGESECMSAAPRTGAVREPRVVVQTTSDIDILDDGYRWRKYGQKVVKGNPNPRSYYKCTHPGCPVRKHVERAAHDLRAVITTYEGKHNHDVPAARGSGSNRALPSGTGTGTGTAPSNSNYYGYPVPNQVLSSQRLAPSTTVQVSSSRFEVLRNPDESFGLSSAFINPPQYPDNMFAPSKTKDEPKDDLFLESALLNIEY